MNEHTAVVRISIDGVMDAFPTGTTLENAARRLLPAARADILLGAMRGGECVGLSQPIESDSELTSLTYAHEEGRRIYERSLRFLFLLAMKRVFPTRRVRMLNSIGHGLYVRIPDETLRHDEVAQVEAEMHRLVEADLPFHKEVWTRKEAIAYFEREGWEDKAELLRYRPRDEIVMYRMGELCEYFYGVMLPSSGKIRVFALMPHFPGVVLRAPDPAAPDKPAPYTSHAKFLRVFNQSQQWCGILGANNAADVNRMIKQGRIREFIRVNEALHDRSIAAIADEIIRRHARIVMIFGPSSSGKTTFANRLAVHLRVLGKNPKMISLDDFYRDRALLPLEADGKPDLEHIDALDVPLLSACLEGLMSGETVAMPRFDFTCAARSPQTESMRLEGDEPLLVEGIHGMNDRIVSGLPEQLTFGVYVSALGCINLDDHNRIRTTDVRLLRRMVRDARFRNTSPIQTIDMWPKVRAGEEKWIFPYQERADVMFNTSLHYELPVLKTMVYELILSIPKTAPEYLVAHRLLKVLHYFLPVDGDVMNEIPPLSILREFIGECAFYDLH